MYVLKLAFSFIYCNGVRKSSLSFTKKSKKKYKLDSREINLVQFSLDFFPLNSFGFFEQFTVQMSNWTNLQRLTESLFVVGLKTSPTILQRKHCLIFNKWTFTDLFNFKQIPHNCNILRYFLWRIKVDYKLF